LASRASIMNAAKIERIFSRLQAANPHPRSELEYSSPFELLVAVILSAQATDRSVNLATPALFRAARTPEAMLALGVEGLSAFIKAIGLFNTKAKNIIAASRILVEQHGGQVPRDRAALESLPGVGRKTANVVLNVAFGEPTIAVDTHIFRVANRTGLARGDTPLAVEERLLKVVPERFRQHAHHWLILHGRYICTARKPGCPECPIVDLCEFKQKTRPSGSARAAAGSRTRRRTPVRRTARARIS
jgi:endonuclease III